MHEMTFDAGGAFTSTNDVVANLAAEGFHRRAQLNNLQRMAVIECTALINEVQRGGDPGLLREAFQPRYQYAQNEVARRYPNMVQLRETMGVSDFSAYLTTDILNIMLWGGFTTTENPVLPLVKKMPLTDLRTVKRFIIDGDGSPFDEDLSRASAPAPESNLTPRDPLTYDPKVYSKKMSIDWKALFNDNWGIFQQMTDWLLQGFKNTIWDFITRKYWDANGPNVNVFKAGNTNLITTTYGASTNNPVLGFQGIADGYTVLLKQLGPDGQPIDFNGTLFLVVGPALAVTAKALKQSTTNRLNVLGGKLNASGFPEVTLEVGKGVIPDFEVIVDKRIPKVTTAGTVANTAWMLVYDPSAQSRPTVELGLVAGFDTPQIWQRQPDTIRPGGGVDTRMGSFDTGKFDYKSVLAMGGVYGNGQNAVASFGQ